MSEILNTLLQDSRVWRGRRHAPITQVAEPTGYQVLDTLLDGIGWPRGALSECLLDSPGIGELHLLLPLMQRFSHTDKNIFWLNPPDVPYAPALLRKGVNLDQVTIIHAKNKHDFLWALENCLRSPVTGLVMAWPGKLASRDTRRLQLATEAGNNLCVLFRERCYTQQHSSAALRLELKPGKQLQLEISVLKRRGSWAGQHCSLAMAHRVGLPVHEIPHVIQGPWPAHVR
jgi:cell division inhibitor SulA